MIEGAAKPVIGCDDYPLSLLRRRINRRKERRGIGAQWIDRMDFATESGQRENRAVVAINQCKMSSVGHDGSHVRGAERADMSRRYLRRKKNSKT